MFYVFRDITQLQRLPDLLVKLRKKKKRAGKATHQQSEKGQLEQVVFRGSAALHLVAGHALLGQLVEVSPHHVPQVVYSLLCLCFKRLLGGKKCV